MKGKWLITTGLVTLLIGSNAFASLARLAVMGSQPSFTTQSSATNVVSGSLWYDDDYNVFYNPSYVNDGKNYVIIEKGTEGGWFSSVFDNFAYGVYLNRSTTAVAGTLAPVMNSDTAFNGQTNDASIRPIELFFGGDTGVKWGLHLAWSYFRNQQTATAAASDNEVTARYWHADFGMQFMGLEPFVGLTFASNYQNTVAGRSANQGVQDLDEFNIGTKYKYEGWTPYVSFRKFRESGTPNAVQLQSKMNVLGLGVGHDTKVADGVHVLKHVGFFMNSATDDTAGSTTSDVGRDFTQYVLPLNVAVEGEATSWLTLRAGIAYDFWNETKQARLTVGPAASAENKKTSNAGTTNFRIGSTLKFGKLHIDSAFGNGAAAAADTAAANLDTNAIGFDSQLFGVLSASYNW